MSTRDARDTEMIKDDEKDGDGTNPIKRRKMGLAKWQL